MESLLRWSIENSTPSSTSQGDAAATSTSTSASAETRRKDLDPAIIDMILGRPDTEVMKEALSVALDRNKGEGERVGALDEFEMLVEQIDNANNMEVLGMWEPIQGLLDAEDSTTGIVTGALWIIGTALQNNPKAQLAYMKLDPPPLQALTSKLASETPGVRAKALYAISGLLKHNSPAVRMLDEGMWERFGLAIVDSDIAIRRKMIFLLNALLIPTESSASSSSSSARQGGPIHPNSHEAHLASPSSVNTSEPTISGMESRGLIGSIVRGLVEPLPYGPDGEHVEEDEGFVELVIRLLHTYCVLCKRKLGDGDRELVRAYLERGSSSTRWGLTGGEVDELKSAVRM